MPLHHNLIIVPQGKSPDDVVAERHDIALLIEVAKANPNGDPDAGNMPRVQPDTLRGLMTDVCLKRKIRNFFSLYQSDGQPKGNSVEDGYRVFIREGAVLEQQITSPFVEEVAKERLFGCILDRIAEVQSLSDDIRNNLRKDLAEDAIGDIPTKIGQEARKARKSEAKEKAEDGSETKNKGKKQDDPVIKRIDAIVKNAKDYTDQSWRDALCEFFFDVRFFGGVTSTEGPLKGSFYGQIRGPIQFGFAESLDRILQLDFSITRCASASEKEKKQDSSGDDSSGGGNRTMGRKHLVDYAIYRTHVFVSPAFAMKTGFNYRDLDNFFFALQHMFTDDRAAARPGGIRIVGLVDFQHSTALGNEHAHKLFEMVKVGRSDLNGEGKPIKDFPQSIEDYCGEAPEGAVREKDEGGEGKTLVKAHRLVWDIPPFPKEQD